MKIVFRDAGIFFRHQCELVLRHQMLVSNYFVKFFYSVWSPGCQAWHHVYLLLSWALLYMVCFL
jgi:hypothetical protein